jgi:hypothetical protein
MYIVQSLDALSGITRSIEGYRYVLLIATDNFSSNLFWISNLALHIASSSWNNLFRHIIHRRLTTHSVVVALSNNNNKQHDRKLGFENSKKITLADQIFLAFNGAHGVSVYRKKIENGPNSPFLSSFSTNPSQKSRKYLSILFESRMISFFSLVHLFIAIIALSLLVEFAIKMRSHSRKLRIMKTSPSQSTQRDAHIAEESTDESQNSIIGTTM